MRYEDEWAVAVLAGLLSAVVAGVAALRERVLQSVLDQRSDRKPVPLVVDAAVDLALTAAATAAASSRVVLKTMRPVVGVLLRPPLVPRRFHPQLKLETMAQRGRRVRAQAEVHTAQLVGQLVPVILGAVLDRIDLTALVLERVKLAAIIDEVDVNQIAGKLELGPIIDRVPIDQVLDRVDVDSVVAKVDLDAIVDRIDVDAVVAKVDLDAIVARIDIDAIAGRLDVGALIDRLDITAIARQIISDVDLPEIIRESSGVMASETVHGVRMQGIEADERVNRIVDKILLRRNARRTQLRTPTENAADEGNDEHSA